MSRTTDESDNGKPSEEDLPDSPSVDDDSCGGSGSGGGAALKKGPWTAAEDAILVEYVKKNGEGNWNAVQKHSGLSRCGKSCRLRWANHLRPNLKKGAFTPEEEQLIIEMHAKLGNKWARMAVNLPGRTDNEIKNYWNTRIKRRQRAGLPLYPSNLRIQAKIENTQDQAIDELRINDQQQNELMQNNSDILDSIFPQFVVSHGKLHFPPRFPDIPLGNPLNQGLGAHGSVLADSNNPSKCFRECDMLLPSYSPSVCYPSTPGKDHRQFSLTFPYDPDPGSKSSMSYLADAIPGSHALTNGNLSTSQSPQTVKLELPSLQFPDTVPSSWLVCSPVSSMAGEADANVETPSASSHSEHASPKSSGLLDALVYEAQAKCSAGNRLSEKSSDSSLAETTDSMEGSAPQLCNNEWEKYGPSSPFECSAASDFSEYTPPTSGNSFDEPLPGKDSSGFTVMLDYDNSVPMEKHWFKKATSQLDLTRPDAFLAWSCGSRSDDAMFMDPITNLPDDDLQYNPAQPGASSGSSQDFGYE